MRTGLLPCWLALCAFLRTLFQALCFWGLFSKVDKVNDTHMIASGVPEKNGDKHAPGILIEWEYNWLLCWISPITHFFVWFSDFWNILYLLKTLPPISLCTSEIATMALDLLNTSSGLRTPDRNRPTDRIQVIFKEHTANQVFQVQNHMIMVYQVLNLL